VFQTGAALRLEAVLPSGGPSAAENVVVDTAVTVTTVHFLRRFFASFFPSLSVYICLFICYLFIATDILKSE
jgi:hypothetical protein